MLEMFRKGIHTYYLSRIETIGGIMENHQITQTVQLRQLSDLPELSTRTDLAEFTKISAQTFARWAVEHKGPRITHLGSRVRYRKTDILTWLETSTNS
jgi:predicted DNA-binding transcriptional regulator AlpA